MNKNPLDSIKRNYFVIGSVLTFFVVGCATLYAKTGGEMHKVPELLGMERSSGLEQEVEIEHGVVTISTKLHGGDDQKGNSTDDDGTPDQGRGDDRDDDSDDEGEHRGRGRDDDEDEDSDDDRRGGSVSSSPSEPTTPAPIPTPVVAGKTFTLAEVATHKDAQSCYTTISGSVYDVTTYIPVHKGGSAAILAICGKDGASLFAGQHAGEPKPEQMLASFKVGTLAP